MCFFVFGRRVGAQGLPKTKAELKRSGGAEEINEYICIYIYTHAHTSMNADAAVGALRVYG